MTANGYGLWCFATVGTAATLGLVAVGRANFQENLLVPEEEEGEDGQVKMPRGGLHLVLCRILRTHPSIARPRQLWQICA